MSTPNILWVISARSGSKRLPNKNIMPFHDFPLLVWPAHNVKKAFPKATLWLSTDSPKYAEIAQKYSIEAPFLRPKSLSGNRATSNAVVLHAMAFAAKKKLEFDGIGLLQPTSPLVKSESYKKAIKALFKDPKATSVVAVKHLKPSDRFHQPENRYLDRIATMIHSSQKKKGIVPEIAPCGGFFIAKWHDFLKNKTFYTKMTLPYLLKEPETVDIDTASDFEYAKILFAGSGLEPVKPIRK